MTSKSHESPEPYEIYFSIQADWGMTKHLGGLKATNTLAELCRINADTCVLIVGCGVGMTACYLAQTHGCRVAGIDLSAGMVARAAERAKRKGLSEIARFQTADAQDLPFEDAVFDAVISESVNAFIDDKAKALSEYIRVTKPGGYVGFNEVTWLKTPPADLERYLFRIMGARFLSADNGWKKLLDSSGLRETTALIYKTNAFSQWADEVRQFEFLDFFKAWCRFFYMFIKSAAARKFTAEALSFPKSMLSLFTYFGYGIYAGRKSDK